MTKNEKKIQVTCIPASVTAPEVLNYFSRFGQIRNSSKVYKLDSRELESMVIEFLRLEAKLFAMSQSHQLHHSQVNCLDFVHGMRLRKELEALNSHLNLYFPFVPPDTTPQSLARKMGKFGEVAKIKVAFSAMDLCNYAVVSFVTREGAKQAFEAESVKIGGVMCGVRKCIRGNNSKQERGIARLYKERSRTKKERKAGKPKNGKNGKNSQNGGFGDSWDDEELYGGMDGGYGGGSAGEGSMWGARSPQNRNFEGEGFSTVYGSYAEKSKLMESGGTLLMHLSSFEDTQSPERSLKRPNQRKRSNIGFERSSGSEAGYHAPQGSRASYHGYGASSQHDMEVYGGENQWNRQNDYYGQNQPQYEHMESRTHQTRLQEPQYHQSAHQGHHPRASNAQNGALRQYGQKALQEPYQPHQRVERSSRAQQSDPHLQNLIWKNQYLSKKAQTQKQNNLDFDQNIDTYASPGPKNDVFGVTGQHYLPGWAENRYEGHQTQIAKNHYSGNSGLVRPRIQFYQGKEGSKMLARTFKRIPERHYIENLEYSWEGVSRVTKSFRSFMEAQGCFGVRSMTGIRDFLKNSAQEGRNFKF